MPRYHSGLFIYNGNAGNDEMEVKLSRALPILSQEIRELTILQTRSVEELKEACRRYAPKVEVFIILGGDGTIHECINSLAEVENKPVIGILPGGTCNDFARALGIPQNIEQAARSIIQGEEQFVDAGRTKDDYFINFWGIGLVTQTSFNIDENQKNRLGVLSYFISALKTMNQSTPFEFTAEVEGERVEGEAVMILVFNGHSLGTRQVPIPSIDLQDGKLDVLIIKNSNLTLFKELVTMNQSWVDESKFQELSHMRVEEVEISTADPQEVDMDGEIKGTTPMHIQVLPGHFTFLMNRNNNLQLDEYF